MCFAPQGCALFRHLNFQKCSEHGVFLVLYILTWKRASRHNGVHFSTWQLPQVLCFVHFDFATCFAPQRRALFRHFNFQKCSENGVFCTVWLWKVLCAATACNSSFLIWPDGSAPAALASLLFDSPEAQVIGKTEWLATFLLFRTPANSFFWFFLFSDLLSPSLLFDSCHLCFFDLSILSEIWLLNFLR